jgi:hypothetical protein
MMMTIKKCIGQHGGNYVFQKRWEAWALEIFTLLIEQWLQNNVGDLWNNRILYV